MTITENPDFPPPSQWEPFASTKEFKGDGTKYIYAKYRDASANESAIAFARPRGVLYIQKNKTLVSVPVAIKIRIAEVYTKKYSNLAVKLFYRAIGESVFQQTEMSLTDKIYQGWIPAEKTSSGIEYYVNVEDGSGNFVTSLPETNPSTQPLTMSSDQLLAESVTSGKEIELELAVGVSLKIPGNALKEDTNLVVRKPLEAFEPPPGITPTGVGFDLSFENGTKTFADPVQVAISYDKAKLGAISETKLRVYYRRDDGLIRLVRGFVDLLTREFSFATNHFSPFFLAEGSSMHPDPIATATPGQNLAIKVSVVNDIPLTQATLYYKVGTSSTLKSLAMTKVGDYFEATIPAHEVTQAGLSYYIVGSDGEETVTSDTIIVFTGPDKYEEDDTYQKASIATLNDDVPQRHNFHVAGDADWIKFHALSGVTYEIKANNLGARSDVVLELYDRDGVTRLIGPIDDGLEGANELISWTAPHSGIYFIKVRHADTAIFGEQTQYDIWVYRPIADELGIIQGIILSDIDQSRIAGAMLVAGLGSAISLSDGSFTLKVEAGTITVTLASLGLVSKEIQNVTVQANQVTALDVGMAPETFAIAAAAGTNGSISCSPNPVNYGSNSVCTLTPNTGYQVDAVTVDSSTATLTDWKYTFTNVTASHTISVTFKSIQYTITATAGANGSITCSPNPVNYGSNSVCTVTPTTGYQVDAVTVDGNAATLTDGKYTFANVTASHTISVTFQLIVTVKGDLDGNGEVDIADAILALKAFSGIAPPPGVMIHTGNSVNASGKVGPQDVIYIIQKAAGLR